ncbi:hypothetical protein CEXT_489441 [Caerostris extrusa]|uniref:Uncharacterized protein n=1 Tax=Caerostris extrusa TaxID=172846 RepID=A0AAV4QL46_CAEEX|nr:hypothetical protein CEXT_489441 [Caerostris extrusa]
MYIRTGARWNPTDNSKQKLNLTFDCGKTTGIGVGNFFMIRVEGKNGNSGIVLEERSFGGGHVEAIFSSVVSP